MKDSQNISVKEQVKKEAIFSTVPLPKSEKVLGFWDAFFVLSGFGIATWCYTQGAYGASFITFKQFLLSVFPTQLLLLSLFTIPCIMAPRFGIDIFVWMKAIFGTTGYKIVTVAIVIINMPWYAVCADLFASAIINLFTGFGIIIPQSTHLLWALLCIVIGTFMAFKGPLSISKMTRYVVPFLIMVGIYIIYLGFSSVPLDQIINFVPVDAAPDSYSRSIESNLAFAITWSATVGVTARVCKTERIAYRATTLAYGLVTPLFLLIGGVMYVSMFILTGEYVDDPTIMLSTLSGPVAALLSLLLVAFANIGTQAVGSYTYSVMLKSSFPKVSYNMFVIIMGGYIALFNVWGDLLTYFGAFLSIAAVIYAPFCSMLVVDFLFVRKQRISLRSAYNLKGHTAYRYRNGFNPIGVICLVIGSLTPLLVYNPFTGEIHNSLFLYTTSVGLSFFVTGIVYYALTSLPKVRAYVTQDRHELIGE